LRLLIVSDVASEGINLHHCAHRLIHFDIPWSLLTLQQRNGRIDRYGQTMQPVITYLVTDTAGTGIRGDSNVLKILVTKDQQVSENIGDPLEFPGLKGIDSLDEEEDILSLIIDDDQAAEKLEQELRTPEVVSAPMSMDALMNLINGGSTASEPIPNKESPTVKDPTLYKDDYAYFSELFEFAREQKTEGLAFKQEPQNKLLNVTDLPTNFKKSCLSRLLPRIYGDETSWLLTTQGRKVMELAQRAAHDPTGGSKGWPTTQLLWEQHPLVDWIASKVRARFGARSAPLVTSDKLPAGQSVVLVLATVPDKRGMPVLQLWRGALFQGSEWKQFLSLEETLQRVGLDATSRLGNNTEEEIDLAPLTPLIGKAIDQLEHVVDEERRRVEDEILRVS
jgi:hypothetical protein